MSNFLFMFLGNLLFFAMGYAIRAKKDERECRDCWADLYRNAWTLELNGEEIKVLPIYEYGKEEEDG